MMILVAAVVTGMVVMVVLWMVLTRTGMIKPVQDSQAALELSTVKLKLALAADRLQHLQAEITTLKADKAVAAQQLSASLGQVASLQTAVKSHEAHSADLSDRLARQQQEYTGMREALETARHRLAATETALHIETGHHTAYKTTAATLQEQVHTLTADNSRLTARYETLNEVYETLKVLHARQEATLAALRDSNGKLQGSYQALAATHKAQETVLAGQQAEMERLHQQAYLQFEKIAGQLLEEKSGRFTAMNREHITALLQPLGDHIERFKKKVEETYDKESKQRFSLEERVKELVAQTNKVSSEANNLANALKGQVKKQGNWGEMILESVLQQSGLIRNREYFLQQTLQDEEGRTLRPDVLIRLPDNRMVIVDSKVSLVAYDRLAAAETSEEQQHYRLEHIRSVYSHIDDLSRKQYDNLETALDFTMMFVPIEPAYLVAIQSDPDLWAYAYARRILLISPTNLIACLKLIADLWKRELQSKNAMEIVRRGELLYEKAVGFVSTMEDIGKHINRLQQSYQAAAGQLNTGQGHLVGQTLKLKELGLKSSKEMPPAMLPPDAADGSAGAPQ